MVEFDQGLGKFNYRVAGVVIHNNRVLLDRNTRNTYWVLPGGHPELMEPMATALKREMVEEVGAEVEVIRLLWIVENFFQKSKPVHELSFYLMMKLAPGSRLLQSDGPFYGEEHNCPLIYQWFPLDEAVLSGLPLYPAFLASALTAIPESPQHIVFEEIKRRPLHPRPDPALSIEKEKKISVYSRR